MRLLVLCVLERHVLQLGQALETLGSLGNLRLYSVLATLLQARIEDINAALSDGGTLAQSGLLRVDDNSMYTFRNKLDLLGGLDERLQFKTDTPFAIFSGNFVVAPPATLVASDFDHLQPRLRHLERYLTHVVSAKLCGANVLIYGPPGTGKTELARLLAHSAGAELFELAVSGPSGRRHEAGSRLAACSLSQRILCQRGKALILFDEVEDIDELHGSDEDDFPFQRRRRSPGKGYMNHLLESNPVPMIWISNRIGHIDPAHLRRFDYHLNLDTPPARVRSRILADKVSALGASAMWCDRMAANDRLGPGVMAQAAQVARLMHEAGVDTPPEALLEELIDGSMRAQRLGRAVQGGDAQPLPHRLEVTHASMDLDALVRGLQSQPQARLCLYGPPGTGKSAFARHLAQRIGRPAMMRRASDIVSAFVGETEARMAEMFRRATEDGAVLILDEADSFLASREAANQRWEISAVNEMLTQMEAFDGVFVATTNLVDRLDEASMRRFDAKIGFDFLREDQVLALLRETCDTLGFATADLSAHIRSLHRLTPGDFATVVRQGRFAPIVSAEDLCNRLRAEVSHKRQGPTRSIGFQIRRAA